MLAAVFRPILANAGELAGLAEMVLEYLFGNQVIRDVNRERAAPFVEDREVTHDARAAAALTGADSARVTMDWHAFNLLAVDAKRKVFHDEYARRKAVLVSLFAPARHLNAQFAGRSGKRKLECLAGDVGVAFAVIVRLFAPSALLIGVGRFLVLLRRVVESALANRSDSLDGDLCCFHCVCFVLFSLNRLPRPMPGAGWRVKLGATEFFGDFPHL
jgi:hypothetical protein